MPSHERKNEGATLTPRASAFIRFVSLLAVIVRNVPQINTRRRCVSGGRSLIICAIWSRLSSSGSASSWIASNKLLSISDPKIPPGILRRNFLRTDAKVWTENLSRFTNLPCSRNSVSFFTFPWCPGARKTSLLWGPSLLMQSTNTRRGPGISPCARHVSSNAQPNFTFSMRIV